MTHTSDVTPSTIAGEVGTGATLGPAIGAGILTIAWALYLVPVLIGILSASPP